MTEKRLYKARGQRMVCGVCGGVAEYFGIDPTLVRLAFLLLPARLGAAGRWPISWRPSLFPSRPQTRTG